MKNDSNLLRNFPPELLAASVKSLFRSGVITLVFVACGCCVGELRSAEVTAVGEPLFHEATNEFKTMKSTLYQHRTVLGRRSGLGHGVMVLIADPVSGALTGFRWSVKARAITVPIAAGRPAS